MKLPSASQEPGLTVFSPARAPSQASPTTSSRYKGMTSWAIVLWGPGLALTGLSGELQVDGYMPEDLSGNEHH